MKKSFAIIWGIFSIAAAVSAQDLDKYLGNGFGKFYIPAGCKPFFAYKTLDFLLSGQTRIYYLIVYKENYKKDSTGLKSCGKAVLPVRLTVLGDNDSVTLQIPKEGSDYSASVRELFPRHLQEKVFSFYKYFDSRSAAATARKKALAYYLYTAVKIFYPADRQRYDSLMNRYFNGEIPDPLAGIKLVFRTEYLPQDGEIKKEAALLAYRQYPPFGNPDNAAIHYFMQEGDTVYILLNADVDGWPGVSAFLARVRPLIEKTLLQFPDVKKIVWGTMPGEKRETGR